MPSDTLAAGRSEYVRRIQRLVSTISNAVIRGDTSLARPSEFELEVGAENGLRLRTVHGHLRFRLAERVTLSNDGSTMRGWTARRTAYRYQVHTDEDQEVLAFHWHPDADRADSPHLHLSTGAGTLRPEFHRAHLPTGEIALEAFLAFVIRDFGVRPLRADYVAVLAGPT